jgi:hypothetical protein
MQKYSNFKIQCTILLFGVLAGKAEAGAMQPSMAMSTGMGNCVRSNQDDPNSVFAAPGMVWVGERFDLGFGGGFGPSSSRQVQAAAYDGQTSSIGLGLHWSMTAKDEIPSNDELPGWREKGETFDNHIQSTVLSASVGGGGVHHLFGVGVGLRYYTSTSTLEGTEQSFNIAPSIAGVVGRYWTLSLTIENPLPLGYAGAPLAVGSGARWQPSSRFAVAVDTLTDLGSMPGEVRFSPMVGTEIRIQDEVPIRLGWTQNGITNEKFITGGIGAANDALELSYGVQLDLWTHDEVTHLHRLALRISR